MWKDIFSIVGKHIYYYEFINKMFVPLINYHLSYFKRQICRHLSTSSEEVTFWERPYDSIHCGNMDFKLSDGLLLDIPNWRKYSYLLLAGYRCYNNIPTNSGLLNNKHKSFIIIHKKVVYVYYHQSGKEIRGTKAMEHELELHNFTRIPESAMCMVRNLILCMTYFYIILYTNVFVKLQQFEIAILFVVHWFHSVTWFYVLGGCHNSHTLSFANPFATISSPEVYCILC